MCALLCMRGDERKERERQCNIFPSGVARGHREIKKINFVIGPSRLDARARASPCVVVHISLEWTRERAPSALVSRSPARRLFSAKK